MAFSEVIGQNRVKKILSRTIEQSRVHHAYLFYGNSGVGKEAMALEFAKALLCTTQTGEGCDNCANCMRIKKLSHPDVVYLFPAPTTMKPEEELQIFQSISENPYKRLRLWANPIISIERIRNLKKTCSLKSFEGRGRVVIIAEAHKMTQEAANSLLKLLEEPPEKMHFILETSALTQILPTIISRCQTMSFATLSEKEIEAALVKREKLPAEKAQLIARIAFGDYGRALELIDEDLSEQRRFSVDILRQLLKSDYDRLILVESIMKENDKLQIKELLGILLLWFRDSLIFSQFSKDASLSEKEVSEKLVNIDEYETLKRFVNAFDSIDFKNIIFEIENAIELINRNVNVTLILIVLLDNLKKYMRRHLNV